ncbi:MAG: hypothetical protein WD059_06375 [Balneolaceae bacterium]
MQSEQIVAALKPAWKIVVYLCSLFLLVVSVDMIFTLATNYGNDWSYFLSLFLFIFVFAGSIISILYTFKYQLIIDENGITQQGLFSTNTIQYSEIDKLFFDVMLINIYGNGKAVSLGNLYNDYDRAAKFIADKVKGRDDITFKGKQKYISRYI